MTTNNKAKFRNELKWNERAHYNILNAFVCGCMALLCHHHQFCCHFSFNTLTQSILSFYWKWFHSFLNSGCPQCDTLSSSLLAPFPLRSLSIVHPRCAPMAKDKSMRIYIYIDIHTHTKYAPFKKMVKMENGRFHAIDLSSYICFVVFLGFEPVFGKK